MNRISRRAFTFIEILLMISFISLVIFFLTPKVKQLAYTAKKTEVIRNLKMMESAVESYYIFSHPNVYPPSSKAVAQEYLIKKKKVTKLEKPLFDPLASEAKKEFGYAVSADGKYYVLYSSGFNGQTGNLTIDKNGKVRGIDNDTMCISNAEGCDKYNCCYNRCDTVDNLKDCQGCDKGCPQSQSCVQGICCSATKGYDANCYGDCVNTRIDNNNCGDCDNVCPANTQCSNGSCACKFTSCHGACIKTDSDNNNCGACDNVCAARSSCKKDKCVCDNPQLSYCQISGCVNTQADNVNCGECGNICPSNSACIKGSCLCKDSNQIMCNESCVNIKDDNANCGRCGNICTEGRCVDGSCAVAAVAKT